VSSDEAAKLDELLDYALRRAQRGLTFVELRKQRDVERWLREHAPEPQQEPTYSAVFVAVATSYGLTANVLAGTMGAC